MPNDYDLHSDTERRSPKLYVFDVKFGGKFIKELEIMADDEVIAENRAYEIAQSDIEVELVEDKDETLEV